MLKRILAIATASLIATSANAGIQCYDLAHGENGKGSTNTILIPPLTTRSPNTMLDVALTNIGSKPVNIKIRLLNQDGQYFKPTGLSYDALFSSSNDPIAEADGSGWAFLFSNRIGWVRINDPYVGLFTTEITWSADACLTEATLLPKIEHIVWDGGNYYDRGIITVNGGNAF